MKISMIGAGKVGSAAVFSILHSCEPDEIVLVDILKNLAEGEALDLAHAAISLGEKTKISGGDDFSLTKGSDFVVITAGRGRKPGETREDLFEFNKKIIESVCENLKKLCPDAVMIVVTNPATKITDVVKTHFKNVIGMENQLDSARAKYYISQEIGVPATEVKSFVTGGHGEEMKVQFTENLSDEQKRRVQENVRNAGMNIVSKKGYTCWGIAAQISEIIKNISKNRRM